MPAGFLKAKPTHFSVYFVKSIQSFITHPVHSHNKRNTNMVSIKTFREMAMAFDQVTEQPHFEKTSFRINKKIFATLDDKKATVTLKLNAIDQSVFCTFDHSIFYPASGAWGKQGWTMANLAKAPKSMLADALNKSYLNVSNKK
jgi:hypothetical protein